MAANPWREPIGRPRAGLYLLGLIAAYNIFWLMFGKPLAPGPIVFWSAVATFWIIPVRWVPLYLMAAGTFFAAITCLIIFSRHKPDTILWEVVLSAGATVLMFSCAALARQSLRSKTPLV